MFGENEHVLVEKEKVVTDIGMSGKELELEEMGPITDLDKLKKMAEAIEAAKNKNLDVNQDVGKNMDDYSDEGEMTIDESILEEDEIYESMEEADETTIDESIEEEDETTIDESIEESIEEEDETTIDESIEEEDETTIDESNEGEDEMTIDDSDFDMSTMNDSETSAQSEEVMFPPITQESSISEDSADELEQIREQIAMDNDKLSEEGKVDQIDEQQLDGDKKSNVELEKIQLQILVDNIQAAEEIDNKPSETNIEPGMNNEPETNVEPEVNIEPKINYDKPQETLKPVKKVNNYEWKESETLPKGWKLKKTRKMDFVKELFLSPGEYIFCSRREALKSLIDNDTETDEIEYMRLALKHEGWKDSANLPEGWKFRKTKFQTFFCTESGILFKSCDEALDHIKSEHQELTEPFLSAFKIQVSKDEERQGWEANNSVPAGWKIRRAEGKKSKMFFLSPQGVQFTSRVKALQYLMKEKYDEEEIVVMRSTLSNEKYKEDQNLPTGWMYKKLISRNQTLILTSFGDILDSFKKVMLYIQFLGIHSTEDVSRLESFSKPSSSENKISKFNWKEDPTLPEGWKGRSKQGKIVSLLDPQGNQFKTRRAALHHCVKNKGSLELINEIQRSLVHEGWTESNELPSGWMYKKNRKNIFLSREGIVIKEDKNAIAYIKRRISKNYSKTDLENFKSFIQTRSKKLKVKNQEWIDDPTIPDGWKTKKSDSISGRNLFLSPEGSKFQSRKKAYLHMMAQSYSKEEIAAMRDKLSVEGWEENELLPEGWIFRIRESHDELVFITTEGLSFRDSKYKVLEFVKSSENYNDSDCEGIEMFYEIEYSRRIAEKYEWVESDETVPEGWKYRFSGSNSEKQHFLSPEGRTFPSRIAALKQMISSKCPEKEIEAMRTKLGYEGWNDDELLPKGWMYKVQSNGSKWTINLISREGLELNDGQTKVGEFLTNTPEYTDDDVQRMEMFYEIQNNKQRKLKYEWLEDEETIPFGWKYRVSDGKRSKMFFLSPDGHEFSSRHSALLHMISSFYQEEEIEEMKNSLGAEGWMINNFLPAGWRMQSSSTEKKFLARSGEIIKGFSAALASLSDNDDYDETDIMKFHKIKKGKEFSWLEDDDTVPYGWKVASTNSRNKQNMIMSPDGLQFASRTLAFQHLLETDADELEITDMREKLAHEGWYESTFLPPGWIFRTYKGNLNMFSKEGNLFEINTNQEAKEFMKNSNLYTEEDVDKLEIFLFNETSDNEQKSPNDLMELDSVPDSSNEWIEVDSVPEGWKLKQKDGKNYGKMSILSPNGISYPSRKVALQSMLGSGCQEEEVEPLRKLLSHEDWKDSELLPTNWFYKLQTSCHVTLLTETGKELKSKESALDVLKDSKHETEKLEMFFEMISAHKLLTKYDWKDNDDSVPDGWKVRPVEGSSTKNSLLSPSGNAYSSRKVALQSLINSGAPQSEIESMRAKLVHEGWKESDLLPECWVYRLFSANTLVIIAEDGKELKSKENTLDHMKKSVKAYPNEDYDKMNMFFDMIFAQKRMLKREWIEDDESVPAAWKVNSKNTLLSPDGTTYTNRKQALKALVKNERAEEEIEEMRAKMSYDGWKTSDMLPKKWLYKRFGSKMIKIITKEGIEIKDSKLNAIAVMKTHKYSKDDLERLETFFEMVYAEGRLSSTAWQEDSETLPKGWKYRIQNKSGKNNFLCPEGLPFASRKAGYQHMLEAKYDPVEIDDMRRMLVHESWQRHDLLPEGWMYKVQQYGTKTIIHVLTTEGTEMKDSRLMVTEFMRSVDKYNDEDVSKLAKFFEMKGGKPKVVLKEEKQEQQQEKQKQEQQQDEQEQQQEWTEGCTTLPNGWKFKKGEKDNECYLSPDNLQFSSRSKSLKHMVGSRFYTEQQINEMRTFLSHEGWKTNANLPLNWLYKENTPGSKTPVILITPEGEVLESLKAGLAVIKNIYNDEDVKKMYRFMRERSTYYKKNIKQEIAVDEIESHAMNSTSDEEFEPYTVTAGETPEEEEDNDRKVDVDVPVIKQEVIEAPTKSVLDTAELESILAKGNFTSSVVDQINNERRKTPRELDMAELNTVLTEGNFTSDIIAQIMGKMNNPSCNINLNSIGMQENRKRKSDEWEGELRRFKKRFF